MRKLFGPPYPVEQCQAIHHGHPDVRDHQVDRRFRVKDLKGFLAISI
jgi:hypothetical protein